MPGYLRASVEEDYGLGKSRPASSLVRQRRGELDPADCRLYRSKLYEMDSPVARMALWSGSRTEGE